MLSTQSNFGNKAPKIKTLSNFNNQALTTTNASFRSVSLCTNNLKGSINNTELYNDPIHITKEVYNIALR